MPLSRILTILFIVTAIEGCSSTGREFSYNSGDSEALNVMKAAGMSAKLKDRTMPKDTVTSITDSSAYGLALATTGYKAPLPGFSAGQMAGLGIAQVLFAPTADTARNSMFAWMPESVANGEPVDNLVAILKEAALLGAQDMGYESRIGLYTDKTTFMVLMHQENSEYCPTEIGGCIITIGVRTPKNLSVAPDFIGQDEKSYFFDPTKIKYSLYAFNKAYKGFSELDYLMKISSHMPKWFYFYIAPRKIKVSPEDLVMVPLVINQGNVLHFIKAD